VQWETSDHFSERINRRQNRIAVCAQNFYSAAKSEKAITSETVTIITKNRKNNKTASNRALQGKSGKQKTSDQPIRKKINAAADRKGNIRIDNYVSYYLIRSHDCG
jgi:hypothetical protein